MTLAQHAVFLACVALAGYVQNLTGFAFGLVLLGLVGVLHVASVPDVANVVSVLTLVNAVGLFTARRPELERAVMAPTLAASFVGVLLGAVAITWLSDHVMAGLRLLLGLTIVGCAVILVLDAGARAQRSGGAAFAGYGFVSGVLGGLFSTAGPPLVYHFYRQPMSATAIRDALVTAFAANSVVRIALMLWAGRFSPEAAWLTLEAVPLVLLQSRYMARRPHGWSVPTLRRIVSALLVVVGVGLAVPAARALW